MNNKIFDEAALLGLFIDKEHINEKIRQPFESDGWICATEAHICLLVKPEYVKGSYKPNGLRVSKSMSKPNIDITLSLSDLLRGIEEVSTVEELKIISPAEKCEECKGLGEVEWEYEDSDGYTHREEFNCPICRGTGNIREEITKPTGRKIPEYNTRIGIYEQTFTASFILKICDAMQMLGIDKVRYVASSPQNGNLFILEDGIQIIIMPARGVKVEHWIKRKNRI